MAKDEYVGNGASLESALQNLYQNINSDGFGEDRLGPVAYDVKLVDKKGELLGQSKGHPYDHAFLNALKDAGMSPMEYNPKNHKLEISAYASLKAQQEAARERVQASGCDGSRSYKTSLTDKF